MSAQENKNVVIRFNKEFIEQGNAAVLNEIVADDFINHTAAEHVTKDIAGLIQYISMLHQGFSDFHIDIHETVADGDIVASRKTIHATHTGVIMGHSPTGKRVAFKVMDFVRLRNGKYIEHWGQNNVLQLIQSLT